MKKMAEGMIFTIILTTVFFAVFGVLALPEEDCMKPSIYPGVKIADPYVIHLEVKFTKNGEEQVDNGTLLYFGIEGIIDGLRYPLRLHTQITNEVVGILNNGTYFQKPDGQYAYLELYLNRGKLQFDGLGCVHYALLKQILDELKLITRTIYGYDWEFTDIYYPKDESTMMYDLALFVNVGGKQGPEIQVLDSWVKSGLGCRPWQSKLCVSGNQTYYRSVYTMRLPRSSVAFAEPGRCLGFHQSEAIVRQLMEQGDKTYRVTVDGIARAGKFDF